MGRPSGSSSVGGSPNASSPSDEPVRANATPRNLPLGVHRTGRAVVPGEPCRSDVWGLLRRGERRAPPRLTALVCRDATPGERGMA